MLKNIWQINGFWLCLCVILCASVTAAAAAAAADGVTNKRALTHIHKHISYLSKYKNTSNDMYY